MLQLLRPSSMIFTGPTDSSREMNSAGQYHPPTRIPEAGGGIVGISRLLRAFVVLKFVAQPSSYLIAHNLSFDNSFYFMFCSCLANHNKYFFQNIIQAVEIDRIWK